MFLSRALLLLILASLVPGPDSRCQVRLEGSRVLIKAQEAPLEEVLTRFSDATGARIVYGTARPQGLVSVEIEAGSQGEALAQLLEGQDLGYALRLDKSGQRVETVILTAKGGEVATSPSAALDPPSAEPDLLDGSADPPSPDDAATPAEEAGEPGAEASVAPPTVLGVPQAVPLGSSATTPGVSAAAGGEISTPEAPDPFTTATPGIATPSFPSPASYPIPASYPVPRPIVIPPGN